MAQFKNTLVGKFIKRSPLVKVINKVASGVTGGILGNGVLYDAVKDTGKSGTKAKTKQVTPVPAPVNVQNQTENQTQKNETMIEKLKLFAIENWKFVVPAVVLIPVAIWYFFFKNKRRSTYKR